MARGNLWTNADGLVVGFGTHTVDNETSAKPSVKGLIQQVSLKIVGENLLDAAVPDALQAANSVTIPAGSLIKSAVLIVSEAFTSGGSAVLDIGTINASTGVIVDDDGIDAAIALADIDAVGDDVACDGAQVGTVVTVPVKVYASYDTAAFTGGEATLVVEYIPAS